MDTPNPASPKEEKWTEEDTREYNFKVYLTTIYWILDFVAATLIGPPIWIALVIVGVYMFMQTLMHSSAISAKTKLQPWPRPLQMLSGLLSLGQGGLYLIASTFFNEPASTVYWVIGLLTLILTTLALYCLLTDEE